MGSLYRILQSEFPMGPLQDTNKAVVHSVSFCKLTALHFSLLVFFFPSERFDFILSRITL